MERTTKATKTSGRSDGLGSATGRALLALVAAASEYGLSPWTLRRAIYAGELPAIRLTAGCNAPIRLRREDIEAWIARGALRGTPLSPAATAAANRDCAAAEATASEVAAS